MNEYSLYSRGDYSIPIEAVERKVELEQIFHRYIVARIGGGECSPELIEILKRGNSRLLRQSLGRLLRGLGQPFEFITKGQYKDSPIIQFPNEIFARDRDESWVQGRNIVDIGCGSGLFKGQRSLRFQPWLARFAIVLGANMSGIDAEEPAENAGVPEGPGSWNFYHQTLSAKSTLPFSDNTQDAVFCRWVFHTVNVNEAVPELSKPIFFDDVTKEERVRLKLEYKSFRDRVVDEAGRILKPGGRFCLNQLFYTKNGETGDGKATWVVTDPVTKKELEHIEFPEDPSYLPPLFFENHRYYSVKEPSDA